MNTLVISHNDIISTDNLLLAWQEFRRGKRGKPDVQEFERRLTDNLLLLHSELANGTYQHSGYHRFDICDPKPRQIHKATVRDRVLNHAIYRLLYPFYDRSFIHDSYSCREGKGTLAARKQFQHFARVVGRNNSRTCWVLKCDIRKFFASIDQATLLRILSQSITDPEAIALIEQCILSFATAPGKGLPLGNLTSQLLVNIYMNKFDQFVKHKLKAKRYIRYADDFVILASDRDWLLAQIPPIEHYLLESLGLDLHPQKLSIQTLASGVDFLGWVHFPHHSVLRTKTKQRMFRRIEQSSSEATLQSYRGLLTHGDGHKLDQEIVNTAWLWRRE